MLNHHPLSKEDFPCPHPPINTTITPMQVSEALRFYSAPQFPFLGGPLAITAIDGTDEGQRCAEFYLFLFIQPTGHKFKGRHYFYQNIPRDIIPDEALHQDALRIVQTELDILVFEERKKSGPDIVPYTFRFDLAPCTPEQALLTIIRRRPIQELRTMRDTTHCSGLAEFLPTLEKLRSWDINEGPIV